MQKPAYYCDDCREMIGDRKHISLSCGPHSGIAQPPSKKKVCPDRWFMEPDLKGSFLHFHDSLCLERYFDKLIKKA